MTSIRLGLVPFLTLILALAGCGDDGGGGDGGGDTGTVDSGGDGGGGDGGGGDGGGGDGGGGDGSMGDGGGGDGGGGDGGSGATCVSHLDPACNDTEYCDFPDNLCGMGEMGVCTPRPTDCDSTVFESACGCNMLVRQNSCDVMANGFDLDNNGSCTPAAETYICGSRVCRDGMEYCVHNTSDVAGTPDTYDCVALPASCMGMTTCDCFDTSVACSDMCAFADGNFTLTCPGG